MIGLIVFATSVAVIWTVLYVAYFRSGSTIHAATGQQPEPYTARQDDLGPFFDDYQPDTRTDFQRSVDAGFVETPEQFAERLAAIRAMRGHGDQAFTRGTRRAAIRMINTRGEL